MQSLKIGFLCTLKTYKDWNFWVVWDGQLNIIDGGLGNFSLWRERSQKGSWKGILLLLGLLKVK